MTVPAQIRILEKRSNQRGDLFTRLMEDLFLTLGYENIRFNVARTGREIDLEAESPYENRMALAECKARSDKVGGDEINKFFGALDAERRRRPGLLITGYFISFSGFTETAVEQERDLPAQRIVLLDASKVTERLVKGRMLVSERVAAEQAGRCLEIASGLSLEPIPDLFAHDLGWIWVFYYQQGKERTHFVLVHADGTLISSKVAREIVTTDKEAGGTLVDLSCLNPEALNVDQTHSKDYAIHAYRAYLAEECGQILVDGLPADGNVNMRLRLENLFVPLHLSIFEHLAEAGNALLSENSTFTWTGRYPVGRLLREHNRLAILAAPGGGKSTLLKRLAVAYSDPARRKLFSDNLPDHEWLPLLLRCRDIRTRAREPFNQLFDFLVAKACPDDVAGVLRKRIDQALRDGEALLLVDGLDEITDGGDRCAFVRNLRTLLATYPRAALVVTSREAGFRLVGGLLAAVCLHTRLCDFSNQDIEDLTVRWHREILGDSTQVAETAKRLANVIVTNDRIRQLAINPLLLTTLLLVKRWIGQLPTRRSVLYAKAIEVLLMTWNREGHEPMELDEVLPQLCFVAYSMMDQFKDEQRISRPELARLLRQAREQLAAELGFTRISISEFIERVEHRSSLLTMIGHDVLDGKLTELYEFRHLTFQEYLAAEAIVHGWYPNRSEGDCIESLVYQHVGHDKWREVVPLVAVLAGRRSDALIEKLASDCAQLPFDVDLWSLQQRTKYAALGNCLADEIQSLPKTLQNAIRQLIRRGAAFDQMGFSYQLVRGKYGDLVRSEAALSFFAGDPTYQGPGMALSFAVFQNLTRDTSTGALEQAIRTFTDLLKCPDPIRRCEGATGLVGAAFRLASQEQESDRTLCSGPLSRGAFDLGPLLDGDAPEQFAACWALTWIGAARVWKPADAGQYHGKLLVIWLTGKSAELRFIAARAIAHLSVPNPAQKLTRDPAIRRMFVELVEANSFHSREEHVAAIVIAYYLGRPWKTPELIRQAKRGLYRASAHLRPTLVSLLKQLGAGGIRVLRQTGYLESLTVSRRHRRPDWASTRRRDGLALKSVRNDY